MKRLKTWSVLALLTVLALALSQRDNQSPLQKTREAYLEGMEAFYQATVELNKAAGSGDAAPNEKLKNAFHNTRKRFKEVEFLLDYLQPQDVKDYINGAPLPKTERNVPLVVVLEPKGLQRIEELVYGSEGDADRLEL
jgi:hypothetical protein